MPKRSRKFTDQEIKEWEARLAAYPPPEDSGPDIFEDFDGWLERSNKRIEELAKAFDAECALRSHTGTEH